MLETSCIFKSKQLVSQTKFEINKTYINRDKTYWPIELVL